MYWAGSADREGINMTTESTQRAAWAGCSIESRRVVATLCLAGKGNGELAYGQQVKACVLSRLLMAGVRLFSFTSPLKAFSSDGSGTCHAPHSQI